MDSLFSRRASDGMSDRWKIGRRRLSRFGFQKFEPLISHHLFDFILFVKNMIRQLSDKACYCKQIKQCSPSLLEKREPLTEILIGFNMSKRERFAWSFVMA